MQEDSKDASRLCDWIWIVAKADEAYDTSQVDAIGYAQYWTTRQQRSIDDCKTRTHSHPVFGQCFAYESQDIGAEEIEENCDWNLEILRHEDHAVYIGEKDGSTGYLHNGGGSFEIPPPTEEEKYIEMVHNMLDQLELSSEGDEVDPNQTDDQIENEQDDVEPNNDGK